MSESRAQEEPSRPGAAGWGSHLDIWKWSTGLAWQSCPALLVGLGLVTLLRGVLPAALALTARGLINAAVRVTEMGEPLLEPLLPWLVLGFVLTAAEATGVQANRYLSGRLGDDLNIRITTGMMQHASSLDVAFFEDPDNRDLMQRTQQGMGMRLASLVGEAQQAATNGVGVLTLFSVLVMIEPLVIIAVPPFALPFLWFQWRLAKARHAEEHRRARNLRWTRYFVGLLTGAYSVAESKLLDLGPLVTARFRSLMTGFRDRDRVLHLRNLRGSSLAAVVTLAVLYSLFVRVAFRTVSGSVSLGDLAIFGGAAARLRYLLDVALRSVAGAMEQALFVAHLREFLEVKGSPSSGDEEVQPPNPGRIEIRDLTFCYPGAAEPVLRELTLTIEPGETVAIVGENGAGKSTLAKLIAGLYAPSEGNIVFEGLDLRDLPPDLVRRRIGFVFQSFGRYEGTVGENIAYGDWRALIDDPVAVAKIGRQTGLEPLVQSLEAGYETVLGRQFGKHTLSQGQWQLIAVARAFARDASIMILDEPTSNLDARAKFEIFSRFKKLAEGRTTIVISHRFTTIGMADRIAVLADGRIVEIGSHAELVAAAGPYSALHELHSRTHRTESED